MQKFSDSLFRTNFVEAICVNGSSDCQTLIGVKDNGLVAVEYSLLNRIKAIFGYGPLVKVDIGKQKVSDCITSNWNRFKPNIDRYSRLKKFDCLASNVSKTYTHNWDTIRDEIDLTHKYITKLQEAGFGFKQAQKWFHLQKNSADNFDPETQSFKALSKFYNCVQTDNKKYFFKLLKLLEDKEYDIKEACFLALSNHPEDVEHIATFIERLYNDPSFKSLHNRNGISFALKTLNNKNALDFFQNLYINQCYKSLNDKEKFDLLSIVVGKNFLNTETIPVIQKLFTDKSYSRWIKAQKGTVLHALNNYPTLASLIETLYMNPRFDQVYEKYKSQLFTFLAENRTLAEFAITFIHDLANSPDYSFSNDGQEITWICSELINVFTVRYYSVNSLRNIIEFIKKLYMNPDYSFMKAEIHRYCDSKHTNCGLGVNLSSISDIFHQNINLQELEKTYQNGNEYLNLEMILRSMNESPISYSKFMELKPDLEPLLTKIGPKEVNNLPSVKDNYALACYFKDFSALERKEACRLLGEIFTPSVIEKLPIGLESAFGTSFLTFDIPLHKVLPYLKDFMSEDKDEDYRVQDSTPTNLRWKNIDKFCFKKTACADGKSAFSNLLSEFSYRYFLWFNEAIRDLKKDEKITEIVRWTGEAWSHDQASQAELKEAEQIVEKKMEALSNFLNQLKLFRTISKVHENDEMKVIEAGFPSELFIEIIKENGISNMNLEELQNLSDPNNEILKNVLEEWSTDFIPPSRKKSARK